MNDYRVQLDVIHSGWDRRTMFFAPGIGVVPGDPPIVMVITMRIGAEDIRQPLPNYELRSGDLGRSWGRPAALEDSLVPRRAPDGSISWPGGMNPKWHAPTGLLLAIGPARTRPPASPADPCPSAQRSRITWAACDPAKDRWTPWDWARMPDDPRFEFFHWGLGSRVQLPGGDMLVPIVCSPAGQRRSCSAVGRFVFDGSSLRCVELGQPIGVDVDGGLVEPSLAMVGGQYYLTMRNDRTGYVASGDDWRRFSAPVPWCWDDGTNLGNYNTQQHWVSRGDSLYLVYTRRGVDNDNVYLHRAPLFLAEVDKDRLCVIRNSERELAPNRGARLGNFNVTDISDSETWVVVAECMRVPGSEEARQAYIARAEARGAANSILAARIVWENI